MINIPKWVRDKTDEAYFTFLDTYLFARDDKIGHKGPWITRLIQSAGL